MSNEQLRGRLAELGWDLTKDSLASILAGSTKRRVMPIGDVILFAWALNVPPIALIFPTHTNGEVSLAPSADEQPAVEAYKAADWFAGTNGDLPAPAGLSEARPTDEFFEIGDIVARLRDLEQITWRLQLVNAQLITGQYGTPEQQKQLINQEQAYIDDLRDGRQYLRAAFPALTLPSLRPALQFIDSRGTPVPPLPMATLNSPEELDATRELHDHARALMYGSQDDAEA
jgi:hypothetical protein